MADTIDAMMQGFINTLIARATSAVAKSTVAGQPGTGLTPSQAVASAAASSATSMSTLNFPPLKTAANLDIATNRVMAFGGAATTGGVQAMQRGFASGGTVNSPLDAALALQSAQSMGFGPALSGFSGVMAGAQQVSNLLPGLGVTGGMQVMSAVNQPRNVNMLRMIGINVRNDQGTPNTIQNIVGQVWDNMMRNKKNRSGTISKDELAFSLQPGGLLWSMMNQYFGNDEYLKQAVIAGLYAKASGAKNLGQEELTRVGMTTAYATAQSKGYAAQMGYYQSVGGAMTGGATIGAEVTTAMTNFATALNNAIPILSAVAGAQGFMEGRAEGGSATVHKPVIVGERGPEVFIPDTSGYVIPNHALSRSANSNDFVPRFDKGGRIKHGTKSDIKKWSQALLDQLGAKLGTNINTPENLEAIGRWAQAEGGWKANDAAYNPLNTTQKESGSWSMNDLGNGMGVQGYTSFQMGVDATVKTLLSRDGTRYSKILDALKKGNNTLAVLNAVSSSPWGTPKHDWKLFRTAWSTRASAPLKDDIIVGSSGTNSGTGSDMGSGTAAGTEITSSLLGATSAWDIISGLKVQPNLGNLVGGVSVAGKRAAGGPVTAGSRYLVGEKGPEAFVPNPSNTTVHYGGVTINIHEVPATMTTAGLVTELKQTLDVHNIMRKAATT